MSILLLAYKPVRGSFAFLRYVDEKDLHSMEDYLQHDLLLVYQERMAERAEKLKNMSVEMNMGLKHATWMINELLRQMDAGINDPDETERWIGFIQGIFWCEGFYSIDDLLGDHVGWEEPSNDDQLA